MQPIMLYQNRQVVLTKFCHFRCQYFVKRNPVERPRRLAKKCAASFRAPEANRRKRPSRTLRQTTSFPVPRSTKSLSPIYPLNPCAGLCERAWPSGRSVKGDRVQRFASACQSSVFLGQPRGRRRQTLPKTRSGEQKQRNGQSGAILGVRF